MQKKTLTLTLTPQSTKPQNEKKLNKGPKCIYEPQKTISCEISGLFR